MDHSLKQMRVRCGDMVEDWTLDVALVERVSCKMRLHAPDGRTWTATAHDVWGCQFLIRKQVEPDGIRLCCNGSRRDAWASGLLRDWSDGEHVYLLDSRWADRSDESPDVVHVLGPAPPEEVVFLAEQLDHVAALLHWGDRRPRWLFDSADRPQS